MDDDLYYLAPGFEPSTLTIPKLRSILIEHKINYPASAKKAQLVDLFNNNVAPQAKQLLAAQARVRRTSRGITDVPSSQASTASTMDDDEEDRQQMRPPPIPDTPRRQSRRRTTAYIDGSTDDEPVAKSSAGRTPGRPSKRASAKPTRNIEEDSGVDMAHENLAVPKRTRKSTSPAVASRDTTFASNDAESPFTQDNPFQSGSSPADPTPRAVSGERRRKTLGPGEVKEPIRTSKPMRRSDGALPKQHDGVVMPATKQVSMPIARITREEVEEPPAGEEFTPEEQQELAVERARNDKKDVLPARRKKRPSSTGSSIVKVATPSVLLAALVGFGAVWRQEKIEVGYCGVGRAPSSNIAGVEIPDWASILQPQCEPCPPHAFCSDALITTCETDFVLQPHPLSLGGLVPLPPSCEPDGEKVKRVQSVADRAVEKLRQRNADYECGELIDENTGKLAGGPELGETQLKAEVSSMRRKGMNQEEFEDLWRSALPEIMGRDEVVQGSEGPANRPRVILRSTSLASIPLSCALRRSLRLALVRHLYEIITFLFIISGSLYTRWRIVSNRRDEERAKLLASSALGRLADQAAWARTGDGDEAYISMAQLRDDVLRDEFSATRRRKLWDRVTKKVENNSNVRPMVRESRTGDVSRVWEWVGAVGALEDSGRRESGRRDSSRLSLGLRESPSMSEIKDEAVASDGKIKGFVKWEDGGRPIY
ncbi:MAG: inner nuclear membrane protein enriched at telomere/subtelomere region [Bogoriella megaspora]|nr:MAG: inner nuclear membrane protein enriched at telomere/subtelomere region [Bogoriella megaspora]